MASFASSFFNRPLSRLALHADPEALAFGRSYHLHTMQALYCVLKVRPQSLPATPFASVMHRARFSARVWADFAGRRYSMPSRERCRMASANEMTSSRMALCLAFFFKVDAPYREGRAASRPAGLSSTGFHRGRAAGVNQSPPKPWGKYCAPPAPMP
jgi:hypothetical protein